MRRLIDIIISIHVLGGAVAFSVIFHSNMPLPQKILWSIGLMFLSSAVFLLTVAYVDLSQRIRRQAHNRADKFHIPGNNDEIGQLSDGIALDRAEGKDDLVILNFQRLGFLLLGMYAVWIMGGWVVGRWI